jgi:sugar phosphate permease
MQVPECFSYLTDPRIIISTRLFMRKIHYGWVVVAVGSLVLFSCFGLARYAYSMLIPAMQAGLGLTYDKMGFIGTGNFIGYLISVLLAPRVMRRMTPRITISAGLLLLSVCMLCISISNSLALILLLYLVVGVGSGLANIPMMALITYWFRSEQRGRAAGLVIGGNGFGIMLAGFLVPMLNRQFGATGWRTGWLVLGLICLAVAVLAALVLRNNPGELGLEPVGKPVVAKTGQFADREHRGDGAVLLRLGLLYLVFGATFMVYGTFMVTTMVKEYGLSEAGAGYYWSWVGFFSLFSGVGFGALSDRIGRKWGLSIVFLVQSVAYLLAGLKAGSILLAVSIVLYGVAVFAIPAIMAAAIGDYLGVSRAASAFATVTIFFAVGQSIGPSVAGMIAKGTGTFGTAYLIASLLTLSAAVFAATLPSPRGEGS